MYNKVRSSFDAELQAMNDLGIGVGRITNYVPQIYDIEAIQTHQDEFITIIAEMIRRDRRTIQAMCRLLRQMRLR